MPATGGDWVLGSSETGEIDDFRYSVYPSEGITSLPKALAQVISNGDDLDPISTLQEYLVPLCELLGRIHDQGLWIGRLNPSDIIFDQQGRARLLPPCEFNGKNSETSPQVLDQISDTFSAPERYGRCTGKLSPGTDVYFLGVFGYALITRVLPPNGCGAQAFRLPVPRVYREDIPHLLGAVVWKACSPYPWRRYDDASDMLAH